MNFEINHTFLIKPFFTQPKRQDKNVNISRTKKDFNINKKHFSTILKGLSLK